MDQRVALFEKRRQAVQQAMEASGLSHIVAYGMSSYAGSAATGHGNIRYLSDWTSRWGPSVVIQPVRGLPTLIVPSGLNDVRHIEESFPWVAKGLVELVPNYGKLALKLLRESDHGVIGLIGEADLPRWFYHDLVGTNELTFKPADSILDTLRLTKDDYEIARHRDAASISDSMLTKFVETLQHFRGPAWKLMVEMEYIGRSLEAEIAACWLAFGQPVGRCRLQLQELQQEVQEGDQVLVGTYVTYGGYWAHCIRMGSVGKPSDRYRRIYDAAFEQHRGAVSEIRAGGEAHRIQARANEIASALVPRGGNHSAQGRHAHFLGLDYADKPTAAAFPQPAIWSQLPRSTQPVVPLRSGMVLEVHTNLGQEGVEFGYIGDVYLVGETGPERLTQFPQDLFVA